MLKQESKHIERRIEADKLIRDDEFRKAAGGMIDIVIEGRLLRFSLFPDCISIIRQLTKLYCDY